MLRLPGLHQSHVAIWQGSKGKVCKLFAWHIVGHAIFLPRHDWKALVFPFPGVDARA